MLKFLSMDNDAGDNDDTGVMTIVVWRFMIRQTENQAFSKVRLDSLLRWFDNYVHIKVGKSKQNTWEPWKLRSSNFSITSEEFNGPKIIDITI